MKISKRFAKVTALTVSAVACGQSPSVTSPVTEPSFGMQPTTDAAFEAQLTQTSVVSVSCQLGVCTIGFEGVGAASLMGAVTYSAHVVQDFTTAPCSQALVDLTLIGANGSISLADLEGSICPIPNSSGFGMISSNWEVTGGTGAFSAISGSGQTHGPIAGDGPVVHLSGTVSY